MERAIEVEGDWMVRNRIELDSQQTKVIVFHRSHRRAKDVSIRHQKQTTVPSRALKYIGFWIDDGSIFQKTTGKAEQASRP